VAEALPALIVASALVVLFLAAIRGVGSYIGRASKFLLAACWTLFVGVAVVVYALIWESNWVPCDPGFGKCAAHIEAQPILLDAGVALVATAMVLAIVAVTLLLKGALGSVHR
jgi:hypothetical protein